jgi:hypothetical protein
MAHPHRRHFTIHKLTDCLAVISPAKNLQPGHRRTMTLHQPSQPSTCQYRLCLDIFLNNGVSDPFDYGLPSLCPFRGYFQHFHVHDDTFAFLHDQPCPGAGSDASSFYLHHLAPAVRGHGRRGSNISVTSPISLYHNHSFRRND